MLALRSVVDVLEDEMMSLVKFVCNLRRKKGSNPEAMVDSAEIWIPPLETVLSTCISCDFSSAAMRLAIRKHISDERDLVMILETTESWLYGGTENDMETVLKSVATGAATTMGSPSDVSPPYHKVSWILAI